MQVLRENPELESCVGQDKAAALQRSNGQSKAALKEAFTALMTCPAEQVHLKPSFILS